MNSVINVDKNYNNTKKKCFPFNAYKKNLKALLIFILLIFVIKYNKIIIFRLIYNGSKPNLNNTDNYLLESVQFNRQKNILFNKCYLPQDNLALKIVHIIVTRFMIEFITEYKTKIYQEDYIKNGIRVMQKYLLSSLEHQSCKNFTWVLLLGNKSNISFIKSLLNFNLSFESRVILVKDQKKFMRNIAKDSHIFITTRIDYDDQIYYDAVNDVRKAINFYKPMLLHGYNRGVYYFEYEDKYYDFYSGCRNIGAVSIFESLILIINKVNDIYSIYDIGKHYEVRKKLLENYKLYGIKMLDYDPAVFDSGDPKFIYVRQNFSGTYNDTILIKKYLKEIKFNLSKFYGSY